MKNDNPLSKKAIELLNENGYSVKWKNQVLFIKHGLGDRILILTLGIILGTFLLAVTLAFRSIIIFIMLLLLAAVLVAKFRSTSGKSELKFDFRSGLFHIQELRFNIHKITNIEISSTLVDEYSSAFKETSQEFRIDLTIYLNGGENFRILSFKSDYEQPSTEILEIKRLFDSEG